MVRATILSSGNLEGAAWVALSGILKVPLSGREYLDQKLSSLQVLLTQMGSEDVRALKAVREKQELPGVELYPQILVGDRVQAPGAAILLGRRDQVERLGRAMTGELATALLEACSAKARRPRLRVGSSHQGEETWVVGILNVTPDSFSDGGRFIEASLAVERGLKMVADGAHIIDVGGESTRPGGGAYGSGMLEVSAEDEIGRVVPVIRELSRQIPVPISIDTRKAAVARAALEAGAQMVNDISGLSHDPGMARLVADCKASLCLMHLPGDLGTLQRAPRYADLLGEVGRFLADAAAVAREAGVAHDQICVDPGIGFGKTVEHNLDLIRHSGAFSALGYPVMIGASRKSFLGKLTGRSEPSARTLGSVSAAVAAATCGASLVRVHDVAETVEALRVADALRPTP